MKRLPLLFLLAAAGCCAQTSGNEFFETRIRPVLANNCYGCHSSKLKSPMAGLALDTKSGVLKVAAPGKPSESTILRALSYNDLTLKMPPGGRLPDAVIDDFRQWIADGAPNPLADAPAASQPAGRVIDIDKGRQWWAYQPVKELPGPAVKDARWPKSKMDRFVLAQLEASKLKPSPQATPQEIVRRVYLDLIGLRPTYDEINAYVNDPAPDKYEKLVDRLLASPQYGERWARYWLDVARYGEDNKGGITNHPYYHAFRYRDWTIEALNKDVPYDRFVKLQLAGDLMPGTNREDLRATGFLGVSPLEHKDGRLAPDVVETLQLDDMDERLDAITRGLLGTTVACARCHDHKFDPIPSKDYYSLLGVIASTGRATRPLFSIDPQTEIRFTWLHQRIFDLNYFADLLDNDPGSKPEQAVRQVKMFQAELALLNAEMDEIARKYPEIDKYMKGFNRTGDHKTQRAGRVDPMAPFINSVYDAGMWIDGSEPDVSPNDWRPGQTRDMPQLRGGNVNTPGEVQPRHFLSVLSKGTPEPFGKGSGRLDLANKIFSDGSALAARVIVNRVWGWHFDKHLVGTPSDFGAQGDKPTNPELLDDLAARFISSGWSLKWLHREIMRSATYRQSSHPRADGEQVDPSNQLLWRMNPRRMDIEAYRDSLLRAAGRLDQTLYGESADPETGTRRTVYNRSARSGRGGGGGLLRMYDAPDSVQHSPMRNLTITPLQQLFVMNSAFISEQAGALAKSVAAEPDPAARVRALFHMALARDPSPGEIDRGLSYLANATLTQYAQVLLATNEEIFWP